MRIAIVGCGKALNDTVIPLSEKGHAIVSVVSPEPPRYTLGDSEEARNFASMVGADFHLLKGGSNMNLADTVGTDLDLVVSMYWPLRIAPEILKIPRHGFLNIHSGDLPTYRGNACPTWAILNREKQQGLTAHLMDDDLDTGPIVEKRYLELTEESTVTDIFDWIRLTTPDLILSAVEKLEMFGEVIPQVNLNLPVLRTFPRREQDMRINWFDPSESILRLVRASTSPLEGAWSLLDHKGESTVVRIWAAEVESSPYAYCAVPGQVFEVSATSFVVVTGDGLIRIQSFTCEGGERQAIRSSRQRLE